MGKITMADTTDNGRLLVLVTDQDRMWVLSAATGGLSTVASLEASASALVCAESRPLCLLADTAGGLATWNPASGSRMEQTLLSSSVRAMAPAPDDGSVAALTEDGKLLVWRLEPLEPVSETAIGTVGQAQLVVTPGVVAIGSESGELIIVGERWEPSRQLVFDSPVTAIAASAAGYLAVGSAAGAVCILGNTAGP